MKQLLVLPVQIGEMEVLLMATIIIVVLLALAVVAILLWQFLRRRRTKGQPGRTSPTAGLHESKASATSGPGLAVAEADTPPSGLARPQKSETTAAVTAAKTDDMSKTQPSPAYRKDGPKTAPVITVAEPITLPAAGRRPGQITWQIAGLTDTGFKRELNEDNLTLLEAEMNDDRPYGVYLVADGMGGHQGGDVASQVTVEAVQEFFKQQPISPVIPYQDWLKDATMAANQAVLDRQEDHTQERKMGSTLVVALVTAGQAHIANVGDSRAYHLNDESIQQVSVDHSLVERLVQLGQLTREEARTHKQRNVIYNTIGDKSDPEISLNHVFLKPGDRLLLCSDGLSSMLPDDEILAISRQQADPAAACRELVRAAKAAGGDDNITAIVVQMDAA